MAVSKKRQKKKQLITQGAGVREKENKEGQKGCFITILKLVREEEKGEEVQGHM